MWIHLAVAGSVWEPRALAAEGLSEHMIDYMHDRMGVSRARGSATMAAIDDAVL
jgi:hypothetical protein